MEHKLHLLDTFSAQGSDGRTYKVRAFEHMARDEGLISHGPELWEPTGQTEYRLDDGTVLQPERDGSLRVAASGIRLEPAPH